MTIQPSGSDGSAGTELADPRTLLFTGEPRLGWIYRDRRTLCAPFPEPPPDADAMGQQAAARLAAAQQHWQRALKWVLRPSLFILIGLVALGGCAHALNPGAPFGTTILTAVILALPGTGWTLWRLVQLNLAKDADPQRWFQTAYAGWQQRAAEHEHAELAKLGRMPEWGSAPVPTRRADIYGGTLIGWRSLLTVHGGKPRLYRVADSNLRFYLGIGRPAQELTRRGRPALARALVRRRWTSWRGRAVKPVVREALSLAAGDLPWPEATAVGGWWNRAFDPEIDLVGADTTPIAGTIFYIGSVKWLDRSFNDHDLGALQRGGAAIPGFEPGRSALVVVSRAGVAAGISGQLALRWGPGDVVAAFSESTEPRHN